MAVRREVWAAVHSQRAHGVVATVSVFLDPDRVGNQFYGIVMDAVEQRGYRTLGIVSTAGDIGRRILARAKPPLSPNDVAWVVFTV